MVDKTTRAALLKVFFISTSIGGFSAIAYVFASSRGVILPLLRLCPFICLGITMASLAILGFSYLPSLPKKVRTSPTTKMILGRMRALVPWLGASKTTKQRRINAPQARIAPAMSFLFIKVFRAILLKYKRCYKRFQHKPRRTAL